MKRLRYSRKFAVLGTMLLVAVAVVLTSLYQSLDKVIAASQRQLEGLTLIEPISRTVQALEQHRGLSRGVLSGADGVKALRAEKEQEAVDAIQLLEMNLTPAAKATLDWRSIKSSWENLRAEGLGLGMNENFLAHTRLIDQMLWFEASIADDYVLSTDHDIDSHHLIGATTVRLPRVLEYLAQIRGYGTSILGQKQVTERQKLEMTARVSKLSDALKFLLVDLEKAGNHNPSVRRSIGAVPGNTADSIHRSISLVESEIVAARLSMKPEVFFNQLSEVIDRNYLHLYQSLLPATQALIASRKARAENTLYLTVGVAGVLVLVLAYFAIGLYYATIDSIRTLSRSARVLSGGKLDERIRLDTQDELRDVGDSLNEMADGFNSLLTARHEDEERMHAIVATALDAVVQVDGNGTITGWNGQAETAFGWSREEAIGRALHEVIIPLRYREAHRRGLRHFMAQGEGPILNSRVETYALRRNGDEFPVELTVVPIMSGGKREFSAFVRDITERKRAEESMLLASLVYQNSSEAMMVTDAAGIVITINPAFTEVTGYTLPEIGGKNMRVLMSDRQDKTSYLEMWNAVTTEGRWRGEIWGLRKNGELNLEWLTINSIYGEDGSVHRRIALFSDITKKKESEELIWRQANFDTLTGLPNRHMFFNRLEMEIRKANRASAKVALMFLDLDHFKEVNDTQGHSVGDLLLKQVALRLNSCVRETDMVGRLGGDEFTVLLCEADHPDGVERVARNILQRLMAPFHLGEEVAYITTSIGITFYPEDATDVDTLLKNADQAMYAAKSEGRNCFNYFMPSMQESAQTRRRLVVDLHNALENNEFRLFYQPIVELATGAVHKAEALIRWQHPARGMIRPDEFIPVAEETGLIIDIGDWVFREAAHQAARWRALYHPDFQISINKSPVQFRRDDAGENAWVDHLKGLGLPGQSIVVEITEGMLLDTNTAITDRLMALREAGMQIALDDFGTGYSSLSYLTKFDIDYLKIDQSFVRNLAPGSDHMALCEAIIVMAHQLGLKVIAEGVETPQQRDLLAAAGCNYGQGYLFSRPMPAEELKLNGPIWTAGSSNDAAEAV